MIQMAAKCPNCGADHNPLLHSSFRNDFDDRLANSFAADRGPATYTWLCDSCGEAYQLDVESDGE